MELQIRELRHTLLILLIKKSTTKTFTLLTFLKAILIIMNPFPIVSGTVTWQNLSTVGHYLFP